MDRELRLAALSRLVTVKSDDADKRVVRAFEAAQHALKTSADFDVLSDALKTLAVLTPKFHGAIVPLLTEFVDGVAAKALGHGDSATPGHLARYQTSSVLVRDAIEVAERVRYVHTEDVLDFLIKMASHADPNVRKKSLSAIEELCEYNIDIFYGPNAQGASPQATVVDYLSHLDNDSVVAGAPAIIRALTTLLSPTLHGTSWSSESVTIRRGAISNTFGVAAVRSAAICLLMRMYPLDRAIAYRKDVLRALITATRRERLSEDADTLSMFVGNAITVLDFLKTLVTSEALPLIQAIEHDAYWCYFHAASPEVEVAALGVRDALDAHSEYQIYKLLIGFEGIFGDWERLKTSEAAWDYSDANRNAAAERLIDDIGESDWEQWRLRILGFSETQSDDLATFPTFYRFLESLSRRRPKLALELVSNHENAMRAFLIPIVRGLWTSEFAIQMDGIATEWLHKKENLSVLAKSLYSSGDKRSGLLMDVIDKAAEAGDRDAILNAMAVAANMHVEGSPLAKDIFLKALRTLVRRQDSNWAHDIWHSREFGAIIGDLQPDDRNEVLRSLGSLPSIDYRAEEVLYRIATHDAPSVLAYFIDRLKEERRLRKYRSGNLVADDDKFEAIPFEFHKLSEPLAKIPDVVVSALRKDYESEDPVMFVYRGARLVKAIYPTLNEVVQKPLETLVDGNRPDDIAFVVAILRTYDGSADILDLCKVIVRAVPERSDTWDELASAIIATGVVAGEYGFVLAYQSKRELLRPWSSDENVRVRAFAEWMIVSLEQMIASESARADEQRAFRRYKYGTGDDGPQS